MPGTSRVENDIAPLVEKANEIWKQGCIRFELTATSGRNVSAQLANDPYDYDVKRNESKMLEALRAATGDMKGSIELYFVKSFLNVKGATVGSGARSYSGLGDDADERTVAHEFGHQIGLQDIRARRNKPLQNVNLMESPGTSRVLVIEQVREARKVAEKTIENLQKELQ